MGERIVGFGHAALRLCFDRGFAQPSARTERTNPIRFYATALRGNGLLRSLGDRLRLALCIRHGLGPGTADACGSLCVLYSSLTPGRALLLAVPQEDCWLLNMKVFTLETSLWLPQPVEDVFAFFADAANLESLTPPWLHFKILTPLPIELAAGTLIDYRLRYRGFPLQWRTEILVWEPPRRFVDCQIKGPYRRWVHEHRFVEQDGGTLAIDRVEYALLGGAFTNALFVGRDLERIFAYRRQRMLEIFGGTAEE